MKRKIRLTENDLHRVIKESVKKVLSEVRGWTLEESDITIVNDESDGKPYMIRLWTGQGYFLPAFKSYGFNEEDALEHVVVYLDNKGEKEFFADKEYMRAKQDGETEEMLDSIFLYVDATMHGASAPHYVWLENLSITPYKFGNK